MFAYLRFLLYLCTVFVIIEYIRKYLSMKKVLFGFVLALTFASCTYTTNVDMESIDVYVAPQDWKYTNYTQDGMPYANNYFYAVVDMPEITRSVFEQGEVKAYIVYDYNSANASKHILPYVRHYEEINDLGDWHYYTETVDCSYGPGWVEFNYRSDDFIYEDDVTINPNGMHFTIVITRKY